MTSAASFYCVLVRALVMFANLPWLSFHRDRTRFLGVSRVDSRPVILLQWIHPAACKPIRPPWNGSHLCCLPALPRLCSHVQEHVNPVQTSFICAAIDLIAVGAMADWYRMHATCV